MQLYAILRRNAWRDGPAVDGAAHRSHRVADEMTDDLRWIRSYVLGETSGLLGSICIYEATSPEAVREHAQRVGMPADEIRAIVETLVVRPDPEPALT